ncbi:MAG: hypothetical protein IT289_05965 [Oligoflexia bacterium]|nr:hypothetical protein [Oligoflexia bacterium]
MKFISTFLVVTLLGSTMFGSEAKDNARVYCTTEFEGVVDTVVFIPDSTGKSPTNTMFYFLDSPTPEIFPVTKIERTGQVLVLESKLMSDFEFSFTMTLFLDQSLPGEKNVYKANAKILVGSSDSLADADAQCVVQDETILK